MDIIDNPQSLSCAIVERRYDLMSFNLEKLRSPLATLTGIERIILKVTIIGIGFV
jgi:hypothetical protein